MGSGSRSFVFAWRGIVAMFVSQPNARIHAALAVGAVALGFWLEIDRLEWILLVLTIAAVFASEAFNTALEHLADATSPAAHPLVGLAKDVAAGAVLLTAAGALIAGILLFGPRLLARL